jgi:hypothetical protein
MRSRSSSTVSARSWSCSSARWSWAYRIRSRRPWVATEISTPSAAHSRTRRAITAPGATAGVSEMITSTATIAATTQPDSSRAPNSTVQISGIRMTMPTPELGPAARISARTEPV